MQNINLELKVISLTKELIFDINKIDLKQTELVLQHIPLFLYRDDAVFAWFTLIACFLNSFSTGSGLSCSVCC